MSSYKSVRWWQNDKHKGGGPHWSPLHKYPSSLGKGGVSHDKEWLGDVWHFDHRSGKECFFNHRIDLKETFVPKVAKTYPMNPKEMEACKAFIDEHLKSGKIRKSQSPQASPFFFVQKKDGGLHPCQDYQYLNKHTIKNAYLFPLISILINKLKRAKYFSKMDIQ